MPPDLRSKKGHQNFFEVSENCGTDCIRPLQLKFDLLSSTGESMSVLYNEGIDLGRFDFSLFAACCLLFVAC